MEVLYKSVIPNGTINCLDWSVLNLLAVSVSINKKNLIGEGFGSSNTHQLLVLDTNRPWEYHCVYGDSKSSTKLCKWSPSGRGLLSVEHDGAARVWEMKDKCINSWQRTHKVELEGKLLHARWVEYPQLPNIDLSKKVWPERYECPAHSSYIHMVCPNSVIFVFSSGLVKVVSFHGSQSADYSVNLDVDGSLIAVKTISDSNGSILCVACGSDGLVKLFTLDIQPTSDGGTYSISATLSTSFHPTGGTGGLMTDLVMHPQMGGCSLHICYDDTNLLLWSIRRDIDNTYSVKKETLEIMESPVTSICCTTLCQCITDPGLDSMVTTPAGGVGEFLLEVGEREDRRKWPVELIVMALRGGSMTILNRNTYQVLYSGRVLKDTNDSVPASKRPRYETSDRLSSGAGSSSLLSLCVSPNGCCVAFTSTDTITVSSLCPYILGEKGFAAPEVSRWNTLLSLAAIKGITSWDIAVLCSRVAVHSKETELLKNVLTHWTEEFTSHADHMTGQLMHQYYTTCAILYSCLEEGLVPSLDQRDMSRLHGISSLLFLSFPANVAHEATPIKLIQDACTNTDPVLENVAQSLLTLLKDLTIPHELTSKLQNHAHWIIETAIKCASRIFEEKIDQVPDSFSLKTLQHSLLLVYIWNKTQPRPLVNVAESSISLLYRVFTMKLNNVPFDEVLRNELSKSLPSRNTDEDNSLTLTRASFLQGFLSGLSTIRDLPEVYYRDRFPCLRPHVQSHYPASDPFSPLGLIVPRELVPPWRDVFVDGHYDIIRGCVLMKSVLQKSRVLQCSCCRVWSLPYVDNTESTSLNTVYSSPTHQWQQGWTGQCICGGSWTLHSS